MLLLFMMLLLALRISLFRIEKKIDNLPICKQEYNPYWDCPDAICMLDK